VHALWQEDGSLSVAYELVFTNDTFASPIDFVDIGLPTPNYSISNIFADVDGHPILDIEDSPYVDYGVALGLGSNAIRPGATGRVRVQVDGIRNVLYTDDEGDEYASAVFSPNWFGSEFVHGTTDLTVIYHLPPGVQPEEPRWHSAPSDFPAEPATGFDDEGRITYAWRNPNANGYTQYFFGASFPLTYVPASAVASPNIWQRLGIDPEAIIGLAIFCGITLLFVGIPVLSIVSARRRRMKYLPPKIAIQGHGIKRGLTAIEAAILMEQPMDKILTMILFAVIKKGAAKIVKRDPLEVELIEPLPDSLHNYEVDFLAAFQEKGKAQRRKAMQKSMVGLVRSVEKKMKGFSRSETTRFYEDIIKRAWAQVEAAETPEVRGEKYDEVMEWTMLDRDYDDRTRRVFRNQPVYVPHWYHHYDPGYSGPSKTASAAPAGRSFSPTGRAGGGGGALPGSDFAASVVNSVQTMSANVVGSLSDFTNNVTKVTNPPPKPTYSSGRGGGFSSGGSSCACACACAGCACACAGGGR
jgi:hypothetical protein